MGKRPIIFIAFFILIFYGSLHASDTIDNENNISVSSSKLSQKNSSQLS